MNSDQKFALWTLPNLLFQVYEDDDEPKPLPQTETKKRIPLTTVTTTGSASKIEAASNAPASKSEADVSKVGRRVNLITLASPSDPKKK